MDSTAALNLDQNPHPRLQPQPGPPTFTSVPNNPSVKDSTAGFMCYTRPVLEAIDFDAIRFIGYAFQIEMKHTAWKLGYRIVEVPITFTDRVLGASKMHGSIVKEAVLGVLSLRFR